MGSIIKVRILGSFCLIDQGEVDWKILALEENEAKVNKINSLKDFEEYDPGRIEEIKNWFIHIKTYDGKKKNRIFKEGAIFGEDETLDIIKESHNDWKTLLDSDLEIYKEKRLKFLF